MAHYAMSSFLLLLVLFFASKGLHNTRTSNHELNYELRLIHREIGLLRYENQQQNKEIDMLKEIMGLQNQKTISEQDQKKVERQFDDKKMDEEETSQHKRPARLLPLQLLFGNRKNDTDEPVVRRFYGPPTNCSELSQLGYTLNGFYLVKAHESNNNSSKTDNKIQVEVISCTFKHPGGFYQESNIIQSNASVSLQSPNADGGTYFRVRMKSKLDSKTATTVLFNVIALNTGGGFYNTSTGQFTVPKTGIYQIAFYGLIWSPSATQSDPTFIHLYVNNGQCNEFTKVVDSQRSNQVLLATRKLYQSEKISIFIQIGSGISFELDKHATFSGFLLE